MSEVLLLLALAAFIVIPVTAVLVLAGRAHRRAPTRPSDPAAAQGANGSVYFYGDGGGSDCGDGGGSCGDGGGGDGGGGGGD